MDEPPPYFEPITYVAANNDITEVKTIEAPQEPILAPSEPTIEEVETGYDVRCFCVTYIREKYGINIRGDADKLIPNVEKPYTGGVVMINYNGVHHVSYITAILPNGNFWVDDANYKKCETSQRLIERDDPRITGFIYRNPNIQ